MYIQHIDHSYWTVTPPTARDFEVSIVSRHPEFDGKRLKKHQVDGIDTLGVVRDEPFEIHIKNNSREACNMRVSLDGVDTLTGKPASLSLDHDMWHVKAGNTLHLKAWHESSAGGGRFVFTHGDKSVAVHTSGDASHKGIIAVAVFTEGDRQSYWTTPIYFNNVSSAKSRSESRSRIGGTGNYEYSAHEGSMCSDVSDNVVSSSSIPAAGPAAAGASVKINEGSATMDYMNVDLERSINTNAEIEIKKSAMVGAGEYVEQRTRTVKGLNKPVLNSIIRMRYVWNDELVAKLKEQEARRAETPADRYPSGFPAEKAKSFADLSGVPRIESAAAGHFVRVE